MLPRVATDVIPNRSAVASANRRGPRCGVRVAPGDIRSWTSVGSRDGSRCCFHRRSRSGLRPSCEGPGCAGFRGTGGTWWLTGPLVQIRAPGPGPGQGGEVARSILPIVHHRSGAGHAQVIDPHPARLGRVHASGYTPVARPASRWDRHARAPRGGLSSMAEHRIVAPKVTGSSPVGHPTSWHELTLREVAEGRSMSPKIAQLQAVAMPSTGDRRQEDERRGRAPPRLMPPTGQMGRS